VISLFNPKVLFIHIPKTAGTSLRGFLECLHPEPRCFKTWYIDSVLKEKPWQLNEFCFIGGHFPVSIIDWLPHKDFRTITFMREPVARTISHFNHLKTSKDAFMNQVALSNNLETFLQRADGLFELANLQTRYLGAIDIDQEYYFNRENIVQEDADAWISGPSIERAFQRALRFLEKCDVVGIVEQMQDSMLLLANSLDLSSHVSMGHANRGTLAVPLISDETVNRLREINRFDLKLYDEAKRIFSQRVATLMPEQIDDSYRARLSSLSTIRNWRYTPADAAFAYGWHGREQIEDGGWAIWSATEKAYIDIPKLVPAAEYIISFRVGFHILQQLEEFRFTVNGVRLPLQSVRCDEINKIQRIFRGTIPGHTINNNQGYIRLGWEVDNRDLGVYLWWCGIENGNPLFR
jgi:hypothetical protein